MAGWDKSRLDAYEVFFRQVMVKLTEKPAFLVFVFAFLIRVSVVSGYASGFFNGGLKGGDSKLYFEIARNLLSGNGFATDQGPTAFVSPLYPIFLAGCMSLFGENLVAISLIQAFLSALACVYIYKIAGEIFKNSTVAFVAGFLAAINYELILWSNAQLLTESIYVVLLSAGVLTLIKGIEKDGRYLFYMSLSGFFFALASLTRPIVIAVALGIFTILIVASIFGDRKWQGAVIFVLLFGAVMLPWGIRNYLVFDSFTISSTEGGHVFWLGNNPQYDAYEHPDFARFGGYTAMIKPGTDLASRLKTSKKTSNSVYADAAWEHIKSDPAAFLKRALHKNWNMWRPNFSGSSTRNSLISFTFYPLMLFTAFIGMFLAWKKFGGSYIRKIVSPVGLLIAVFLMHILIHSVITGEIRFRVPLWIVLLPFSAFTLTEIFAYFNPAYSHRNLAD